MENFIETLIQNNCHISSEPAPRKNLEKHEEDLLKRRFADIGTVLRKIKIEIM